jgi:peroxiredoxin
MRCGKNVYIELPFYGLNTTTGDTLNRYKIPDYQLQQIDNQTYKSDSLTDKISVIYRFSAPIDKYFTISKVRIDRCYDIFGKSPILRFVGIIDEPSKLNQTEVDTLIKATKNKNGFSLLKSDSMQTVLRNYTFYDFKRDTTSCLAVLVDKKKHIRGQYNVARKDDAERLMDEIKLLIVQDKNGDK